MARMVGLVPLQPVDYVVLGHVSADVTPGGIALGGTAAYAALTARVLGLKSGLVTSFAEDLSLEELGDTPVLRKPSQTSTSFENLQMAGRRDQILKSRASEIGMEDIPLAWRRAPIVHLGPIAAELPIKDSDELRCSFLGVTPQGWMRAWDAQGRVSPRAWEGSAPVLAHASAVVISREDVRGDEEVIEEMARQTRVLAVTDGPAGSVLYWHGDRRRFRAPVVEEVDPTGAGDVYAAGFFWRLSTTRDPWEAARFATALASFSVTRVGLKGIPTSDEVELCRMQVMV